MAKLPCAPVVTRTFQAQYRQATPAERQQIDLALARLTRRGTRPHDSARNGILIPVKILGGGILLTRRHGIFVDIVSYYQSRAALQAARSAERKEPPREN